jgi:hypothetical protein
MNSPTSKHAAHLAGVACPYCIGKLYRCLGHNLSGVPNSRGGKKYLFKSNIRENKCKTVPCLPQKYLSEDCP